MEEPTAAEYRRGRVGARVGVGLTFGTDGCEKLADIEGRIAGGKH